jgi:hypothetical protein
MHERPYFVIDEQATFKDVAAEFDSHELYSRLGFLDDDEKEMFNNRAADKEGGGMFDGGETPLSVRK